MNNWIQRTQASESLQCRTSGCRADLLCIQSSVDLYKAYNEIIRYRTANMTRLPAPTNATLPG